MARTEHPVARAPKHWTTGDQRGTRVFFFFFHAHTIAYNSQTPVWLHRRPSSKTLALHSERRRAREAKTVARPELVSNEAKEHAS